MCQYQDFAIEQKDITLLQNTNKINQLFRTLANSYDCSSLARVLLEANSTDVANLAAPLIQNQLKTVYLLLQHFTSKAILLDNQSDQEIYFTKLETLKTIDANLF